MFELIRVTSYTIIPQMRTTLVLLSVAILLIALTTGSSQPLAAFIRQIEIPSRDLFDIEDSGLGANFKACLTRCAEEAYQCFLSVNYKVRPDVSLVQRLVCHHGHVVCDDTCT